MISSSQFHNFSWREDIWSEDFISNRLVCQNLDPDLDRNDGSFLVRYRMYASYTDLHVQILLKDKLVGKSPYVLKGERIKSTFIT